MPQCRSPRVHCACATQMALAHAMGMVVRWESNTNWPDTCLGIEWAELFASKAALRHRRATPTKSARNTALHQVTVRHGHVQWHTVWHTAQLMVHGTRYGIRHKLWCMAQGMVCGKRVPCMPQVPCTHSWVEYVVVLPSCFYLVIRTGRTGGPVLDDAADATSSVLCYFFNSTTAKTPLPT